MRKLIVGAATALSLTPLMATGAQATPSHTYKAVTHAAQHPDTCGGCGSPVSVSNGPVWAYDNLSRQFDVTNNGDGTYTVVITDRGSFDAFAEPNNPDDLGAFHPISAHGSVHGTYTLTVTDAEGPDRSALPAHMDGTVSTTTMVQALFGGNASSVVGGDYSYTYRSHGQTYTQDSNGVSGDITGK